MSESGGFESLFAPEPVPARKPMAVPWKVLLIDDEPDIHAVLRLALRDIEVEGRPLYLLDAHSAAMARTVLAEHPDIALILLDVVMETDQAGLDLVRHIRRELGNRIIQIVLVTGQPGYAPERDVVMEYEINGYRLKSELTTDNVFVSVYTGLRTHQALKELEHKTRELELARQIAEAASLAKSTFLANMSHELRTPMNAIIGMTALALRGTGDPRLRDQLGKIDQASQHLLSIINDILDISRIEADRMMLELTRFEFADVLQTLQALIDGKFAVRQVDFCVDLPPGLVNLPLLGDAPHLTQILLNLVSNAFKFTAQGSIVLRAKLVEERPGDVLVRWEVEDTGIGISPGHQERIFSAFEQGDGSTTRRYGGTGLGLAISKRLVHLMGGDMGVTSTLGQGSTFWFEVRFDKVITPSPTTLDLGASVPPLRMETAEARLRRQFQGARILLAEDEPINQEVSRGLLEEVGLEVDLAEDGREAVALAMCHRYALILMDLQMPHLDGIEATRIIRADSTNRTTPILAVTANAFEEDRQCSLDAGMDDHLPKPVDPEKLYETVLGWLERDHSGVGETQ